MRHTAVHLALLAASLSLVSPASARAATNSEAPSGPFTQVAVGISLGTQGVGFQVATPLVPNLSLRGGADFLPASINVTSNNINYDATLSLKSGQLSLDWTPFHGTFRISPGVMFYNGSNASVAMSVPAGQSFTVNHTDYISSSTDPIAGQAGATFPKAGPRITIGWGNMLPRRESKHFALTSDIGFAYFGTGTVTYNFTGTECATPLLSSCHNAASDTAFQTNVTAQRATIQNDMKYARFYPILQEGLSFRF